MTDLSSADFCKLSVQEVADLLLERIDDDHETCSAVLHGCSDGKMFELKLVMRGGNLNE